MHQDNSSQRRTFTAHLNRGIVKPLVATAVALGSATAITIIPTSVAQEATTTQKTITAKCKTSDLPVVGAKEIDLSSGIGVNVTAPTTVTTGEEFEVKIQIEDINIDLSSLPSAVSLQRASRLKLDVLRPAGTTLVDYSLSGGNLDTANAQIITVNTNGVVDPNGTILRLTDNGHNTIGNGGNESTKSHAGLGLDLAGKTSISLQFPVITLKFRADRPGSAVLGLRDANKTSPAPGDAANAITLLASAGVPILGTQWVSAGCVPQGDANNLATIQIAEKAATPTTTTLEGPATTTFGTEETYTATVSPGAAGTMRFSSGDTVVESPVDASSGSATAQLALNKAGTNVVTATFVPEDAKAFAGSSATKNVEVTRSAADMTVTLPEKATVGARTEIVAVLPEGAKGTLKLTASDGQVRTIPVSNGGRITNSFVFSTPGGIDVDATFEAADDSPVTINPAQASTTVEAAAETQLALGGLDGNIVAGQEVEVTATVAPAPNTSITNGVVTFTLDGQRIRAAVLDGKASVRYTFNRPGDVQVSASYAPSSDSDQTGAQTELTTTVLAPQAPALSIAGEDSVVQGTSAAYTFTVDPATEGTVDVYIDGRSVAENVPVDNGTATAEITIPRGAAENSTLKAVFTSAQGDAEATAEKQIATVPVTEYGDVTGEMKAAKNSVGEGETVSVQFVATPSAEGVIPQDIFGYIELANNGTTIQDKAGQAVRVPVVQGLADMAVTFPAGSPASNELTATFYSADGNQLATASTTISYTGGNGGNGGNGGGIGDEPLSSSGRGQGSTGGSSGSSDKKEADTQPEAAATRAASEETVAPVIQYRSAVATDTDMADLSSATSTEETDSPDSQPQNSFLAFLQKLLDFFKKIFSFLFPSAS